MPERRVSSPTPAEIREARRVAGLSQTDAAILIHLGSFSRWSEYERGLRAMDLAKFELFKIKTGQHESYGPKIRVRAPQQRREPEQVRG